MTTPEEIRAQVDTSYPRTHPDGSINAQHVAVEQTLRERHGLPSYIAALDGPGKFRTFDDVHAAAVERVGAKLARLEIEAAAVNAVAVASVAYRENRLALSRTLRWSLGYGLELPELVSTSGLPEALVLELLDEVD
ncbi:hypothetical protein [Blastococcus sp. CT_GayMR16]|uniref:hypothetical protein n=1 Tax=Blastococcus sp. CT_GayMR16 TaxID=2559607 RepID=UPI00107444BE|nr:hypothetical protein [Blastococcus sp. CT_GayMR16]TFV90417.1 hypothetical protein E4P38_02970 [Blastococcus sp. CT_GayMR16]